MAQAVQVLFNADVRAMDGPDTRAEAIAWRDGRILSVGSRAAAAAAAGAAAVQWDAGGATVLPGFVDAHQHPCVAAIHGGQVRLAAPAVTDIPGLQRALSAASSALPRGQWLVAMDWNEFELAERRPPTRRELDDAVPDHPLMAMHYTCHRVLANSRALELAGIDRHTPDPSGGIISRGPGGLPDGLLIERGMSKVETLARQSQVAHDAEGFLRRLQAHHRALLAVGITRVADAAVPPDLADLYREAARRGTLLVPTVMMPVSLSGWTPEPRDILDGPVTGEGDELLAVGPLKLVFDGAPTCAMCISWWQLASVTVSAIAMSLRRRSLDPVRMAMSTKPRLGRKLHTGVAIYRNDEARDIVRAAAERGFALAIHALGNEAIATTLAACEAAGGMLGRAGIPRIEHCGTPSRDLVVRTAAVGAAVVTQPYMINVSLAANAPPIPGLPLLPSRWLLDAGIKVAGSSDFPCTGFDPLDGIRAAVTRCVQGPRGTKSINEPEQCVTLDEALRMYTRTSAEVCGFLDRCGTLEAGKRADLVVLNGPLSNSTQLAAAQVRATVLGGEVVFGGLTAA